MTFGVNVNRKVSKQAFVGRDATTRKIQSEIGRFERRPFACCVFFFSFTFFILTQTWKIVAYKIAHYCNC
jgi:hypothetical protein